MQTELVFHMERMVDKMKQHIIFECETCGKQSENREEIMKCEVAHLGLTISEKQEWESLKERVRYSSSVVSRTKNEETDKAFDEAVETLLAFEKEHRIKER